MSCMLISCIYVTSPSPRGLFFPRAQTLKKPSLRLSLPSKQAQESHPPSSNSSNIFIVSGRTQLLILTSPFIITEECSGSFIYVLPMLISARTPMCPDAKGILLEAGDENEVSALLVFDPAKLCREGSGSRQSNNRHETNFDVEDDEDMEWMDEEDIPQDGGYVRVGLPTRLHQQQKYFNACVSSASQEKRRGQSRDSGRTEIGLLCASIGRFLLCVSGGLGYTGKSLSIGCKEVQPTIWLLDRQGLGRWRSIDMPESTEASVVLTSCGGPVTPPQDSCPTEEEMTPSDSDEAGSPRNTSQKQGWTLLTSCVTRPLHLTVPHRVETSTKNMQMKAYGPVQAVIAVSFFGPHSMLVVTVRGLSSNSTSSMKETEKSPSRCHLLEIVSKETSRVAPSTTVSSSGWRQMLTLPHLHRTFRLHSRLTPRQFNVLLLPEDAHMSYISHHREKEEQTQSCQKTEQTNGNIETTRSQSGETTLTGLSSTVSESNEEILSAETPRSMGMDNTAQDIRSSHGLNPKASSAKGSKSSKDELRVSSCAVVIADGWQHFHCYKLVATLEPVTSSSSSQTYLVPVDYSATVLWVLDLKAVLGPRPVIDLSYPIRETVLIPSSRDDTYTKSLSPDMARSDASEGGGKVKSSGASITDVSLVVLDGLGNLLRFDVCPFVEKDTDVVVESNDKHKRKESRIEVFVECIGEGFTNLERVDGSPTLPAPLKYALMLYPDGDEEAASLENGTEFCCKIYLPLMHDMGLLAGPALHKISPTSLTPFGCIAGTLALHLRTHSLSLPHDMNVSPGSRLLRTGGTATVAVSSVLIHYLDGLVEAVTGVKLDGDRRDVMKIERDANTAAVTVNKTRLISDLLQSVRREPHEMELIVRALESRWRAVAEASREACTTSNYALTSSVLFSCDDQVLLEVISRLGRKLEPYASQNLFPLPSVDRLPSAAKSISLGGNSSLAVSDDSSVQFPMFRCSDSPWNPLALLELCLTNNRLHHASRLLMLACEQNGGSTSVVTIASSLVIAIELLTSCLKELSLLIAGECLDFCLRLELMIRTFEESNSRDFGRGSASSGSKEASGNNRTQDKRSFDDDNDGHSQNWGGGLFSTLGRGVLGFLSILDDERPFTLNGTEPVDWLTPVGSSRHWTVASSIEDMFGPGGFSSRIIRNTCSVTMLSVALVCKELLSMKRYNATALIMKTVLSRRGTGEVYVNGVLSAIEKSSVGGNTSTDIPSNDNLQGQMSEEEKEHHDESISSVQGPTLIIPNSVKETSQSERHASLLLEAARAFRLQKVSVGQLPALWNRKVSSTAFRQHVEQELQHVRLRRGSGMSTPSPRPSPRGSLLKTAALQPHGPLTSLDTSIGMLEQSRTAVRSPVVQFEVDESLFWRTRPEPLSKPPSPVRPLSGTRSRRDSHGSVGGNTFLCGGTSVHSLVRNLAACAVLVGDTPLAVFLLLLLDRVDLAAICVLPALSLNLTTVRRLHCFCAAEDGEDLEALGALSEEELRTLGAQDIAVQLRGVLLTEQESSVAELVPHVVETLASLMS